MDGNGDLAKLAVVPAGHEKDVEPFLQNQIPLSFEASGPEFQAQILNEQNACSDHLTFQGCVPILGMETLSRPYLPEPRPDPEFQRPLQAQRLAELNTLAKGL
jgi:hypothetical protein